MERRRNPGPMAQAIRSFPHFANAHAGDKVPISKRI
jgi:hypothetical protein